MAMMRTFVATAVYGKIKGRIAKIGTEIQNCQSILGEISPVLLTVHSSFSPFTK
jgi:hypothetical protein